MPRYRIGSTFLTPSHFPMPSTQPVAEQAADFVGTELNHDSESALEAAIESLAEWIRERLENDLKLEEAKGLAYDILWSWFGEVNWREIAKHYCEEAQSAAVAQEEE